MNSRRKMREASRSLAIAFNIGRVQEALYRADAGETLQPDEKALFEQLARLFAAAGRAVEWTQATVDGAVADEDFHDGHALRSLSLVLPIIRNYPTSPRETLELLARVSTTLGSGGGVDRNQRVTFDTVLGDLAASAGGRLEDLLEDRSPQVSLKSLP